MREREREECRGVFSIDFAVFCFCFFSLIRAFVFPHPCFYPTILQPLPLPFFRLSISAAFFIYSSFFFLKKKKCYARYPKKQKKRKEKKSELFKKKKKSFFGVGFFRSLLRLFRFLLFISRFVEGRRSFLLQLLSIIALQKK